MPEASAAREARINERTDVLCLEQLLAKAWMIYVFVPCAMLMAYLADAEGERVWALLWLAAMIARDIYAWFQIKRLRQAPLEPTAAVVRELQLGFVVAGILAVALLPVFFCASQQQCFAACHSAYLDSHQRHKGSGWRPCARVVRLWACHLWRVDCGLALARRVSRFGVGGFNGRIFPVDFFCDSSPPP